MYVCVSSIPTAGSLFRTLLEPCLLCVRECAFVWVCVRVCECVCVCERESAYVCVS